MAVLSAPTNTPTVDGATAVCVSDDATGTVCLSVRTDRQWYSVANGDSQGLADADKATIIAGTTDSNIVFADNQAASLDPEQIIDGLAARLDPANPYYVGWVQDGTVVSTTIELLTDKGPFTFLRASVQSALISDSSYIEQASGESAHTLADWSGSAYSNTSGLSRGILLEPERANTFTAPRDFSDGAWRVSLGSLAVDEPAVTTPFNDVGCTRYKKTVTTNSGGVYQSVGSTNGVYECYSLWVKPAGYNYIQMTGGGSLNSSVWQNYELIGEGALGNGVGTLECSIKAVGDGWYRVTYLALCNNTTSSNMYFAPLETDVNARRPSWSGDNASGFYIALAQREVGVKIPSGPIQATITRAATSMSGALTTLGFADFTNDAQLTLKTTLHFASSETDGSTEIVRLGTTTNGISVSVNGSTFTLTRYVAGADTDLAATHAFAEDDEITIVASMAASGMSITINEGTPSTNASGTSLAAPATTCELLPALQSVATIEVSAL